MVDCLRFNDGLIWVCEVGGDEEEVEREKEGKGKKSELGWKSQEVRNGD